MSIAFQAVLVTSLASMLASVGAMVPCLVRILRKKTEKDHDVEEAVASLQEALNDVSRLDDLNLMNSDDLVKVKRLLNQLNQEIKKGEHNLQKKLSHVARGHVS